jgi:hypothetical protein
MMLGSMRERDGGVQRNENWCWAPWMAKNFKSRVTINQLNTDDIHEHHPMHHYRSLAVTDGRPQAGLDFAL